jgi:polysaccharide biosynthesis protein PslH
MRCLFLTPFLPFPPRDGGRVRMFELMRGLAARHEVDLLSLGHADDEAIAGLTAAGVRVVDVITPAAGALPRALARRTSVYHARYGSERFASALRARLRRHDYDVVQCEYAYMAQYRQPVSPAAWVLDQHNIEYQLNASMLRTRGLAYRLYARRELRLRRAEEIAAFRAVDHVLAVSDLDRDTIRRDAPGTAATVVPNGVALDEFLPAEDRGSGAVYVGKMDYQPNVDAVRWFCERVLPAVRARRPGFTLTIVGSRPTDGVRALARMPGVTVTGEVPDTRPHLHRAAIVVVPVRAGGGTRLKVLEAFASGRAVVSTRLGCEGIAVADGEHLLLADDADAFAAAVLRLLDEPALRASLARSARELVEGRYGWDAIVERLDALYGTLAPAAAEARA